MKLILTYSIRFIVTWDSLRFFINCFKSSDEQISFSNYLTITLVQAFELFDRRTEAHFLIFKDSQIISTVLLTNGNQ
jgi:hypothetical protein